jgi:oligopeptide/dipeptide ABC transporter ATP-binding protein
LLQLPESAMNSIRGNDIGVIFQDPMTSLDPAFTIGSQISAVLRRHTASNRQAARRRAVELLGLVGIGDPARRVDQYPHQLSGGMRQRVMIAIAIACEPKLLIADEPTTALDATTQAQILELIKDLSQTLGMSTIITTHDLGVVAEVCDTVAVMYAGQIVEQGTTEQIFYSPQHPYTERLLRSLPRVGVLDDIKGIPGRPPTAGHYPAGCRFAARCEFTAEDCTMKPIDLETLGDARQARCVRVHNLSLPGVLS